MTAPKAPPPPPPPTAVGVARPLRVIAICPLAFERRILRRFAKLPTVGAGPGPDGIRRAFSWRADWPFPQPDLVVLVGTAGALNARCIPGSDHLVREVCRPDGSVLVSRVVREADARVVESPLIVSTREAKRALGLATKADLVDLESFAFAECAESAGLRWAIVRGVSDGVDDVLPRECAGFINDAGETRLLRVLRAIALRPRLLVELAQIGRTARRAMRSAAFTTDGLACVDTIELCNPHHPLLLYGGSFDPPHARHASMLADAVRALQAPCALVVPAALNPLKCATPPAPADARIAMCEATFKPIEDRVPVEVRISAAEVSRPGPSYTFDTVQQLLTERPALSGSLRMLLGSDALRDIMRWHRWRELLALVQPAVVVRPPDDHASVTRFLKEFGATQGFADAPTWLLSLPPVELASTEIRRAIAAGMRPAGIAEDAWREISARGLYGFGEVRERIYTL